MTHIEAEGELKRWMDCEDLEIVVMKQTPSEAARRYCSLVASFGAVNPVRRAARMALGAACRYRGLEMVKALVEGGAKMIKNRDYVEALLYEEGNLESDFEFIGRRHKSKMLPINERLRILDYLCKTADKTGFDKDDFLFYAYFSDESEIIDLLKKNGAVIPEMWIRIVTKGGRHDQSKDKWDDYCDLMRQFSNDDFIPRVSAFISEIGGRMLRSTDYLWRKFVLEKRQDIPGFFKFLFDNFDLSKVDNGSLMKSMIERNSVDGLAAAAELGWLEQPKKRDRMIAFALEIGATDCTAWLLDFKNRTADPEAERREAEMKLERELNAAPDSSRVLSRFWSFRNRDDGTKIIKGYKGNKTEITVPERIGGAAVTAIGEMAFSPYLPGITAEARAFRSTITEITLPESVCEIGEDAFLDCIGLRLVNIPGGVTEIDGEIFRRCPALSSVIVARGSYAEQYCVENKIPFNYKE